MVFLNSRERDLKGEKGVFDELPTFERLLNKFVIRTEGGREVLKSLENPSVPLTDPNAWAQIMGGALSDSGEAVNDKTALSITALWNGIAIISAHFASFPFNVYKKIENGRERDINHPANKLLSREPNDIMTSFDFRRVMMLSALMKGNGFAEIIRNGTYTPLKLNFLHPENVEIKATESLVLYKYKRQDKDGRIVEERTIQPENMLHLKGLSLDGISGMNVIQYHQASLGLSLAQRSMNNEYYKNGAAPSAVIEGAINDNQIKQVKSTFARTHIGVGKRFGVPVMPMGLTYKPISFTARDMETLGQMKMTIEDVARILNIPLHKLKNLDRATNNNIEHQDLEYYKDCLLPWLVSMEQECNRKLLTEKEKREETHFTKHNVNAILRADMQSRAEFYSLMRQNKVMTANEVRALEELNPMEGGDVLENPNIQVNESQDNNNTE